MKKAFSIFFALIIILSGLHFSIAAHYCGGELTAFKLSVDQEKASCGMCAHVSSSVASVDMEGCCQDAMSVLNVDHNYQLSQFQLASVVSWIVQVFAVPSHIGLLQPNVASPLYANIHPPGDDSVAGVNLADICVFRI